MLTPSKEVTLQGQDDEEVCSPVIGNKWITNERLDAVSLT